MLSRLLPISWECILYPKIMHLYSTIYFGIYIQVNLQHMHGFKENLSPNKEIKICHHLSKTFFWSALGVHRARRGWLAGRWSGWGGRGCPGGDRSGRRSCLGATVQISATESDPRRQDPASGLPRRGYAPYVALRWAQRLMNAAAWVWWRHKTTSLTLRVMGWLSCHINAVIYIWNLFNIILSQSRSPFGCRIGIKLIIS